MKKNVLVSPLSVLSIIIRLLFLIMLLHCVSLEDTQLQLIGIVNREE